MTAYGKDNLIINLDNVFCVKAIIDERHRPAILFSAGAAVEEVLPFLSFKERDAEMAEIRRMMDANGLCCENDSYLCDTELSARAKHCLAQNGIITLSQLVRRTDSEIRSFNHLGEKTFIEIKEFLSEQKLSTKGGA